MKLKYMPLWALVLTGLLSACSGSKKMVEKKTDLSESDEIELVVEEMDTVDVTMPTLEEDPNEQYQLEVYRASYPRTIDIVHTQLDLAFDFEKEAVLGEAWITFCPIFNPVDSFRLDAQYFDIHKLTDGDQTALDYDYSDNQNLWVYWPETIQRGDTVVLYMDYTAVPGKGGVGGSAAITSDKGLFFINPRNEIPNKPRQIWTQGETEHNSNWFPTVDKPNERTTQELALTVPEEMKTLSNGLLVKSESVGDGMRKDYWKQDLPHAPYLFMIAVGDFAVVEDAWEDVPVHYYVEHDYEPYAAEIFDHTPEMLAFFSKILDYRYPWAKYDQVIVRDYVSGAMENTTGVIFGDFVQKYGLDLPGNDNDFIVAHEMFHHWFGDLVTCESWSNLTMNEGFANYSEYLWKEYQSGKDLADNHRLNEIQGYLGQARQNMHPLIDFKWVSPEQMFDAHSYNKGGLVLHMLRHYLGSELFFAGLNLFLERNAFTAVEAHDLRLAMEDVCGEDLNWFFNQWYFEQGHPKLTISDSYTDGQLTLSVEQTQDPEMNPAIFQLPTEVDIYTASGERMRKELWIDQRLATFKFEMEEAPALIVFDPDDILLAEIQHEKSAEAYAHQYQWSKTLKHRVEALKELASANDDIRKPVYEAAMDDIFGPVRAQAINRMSAEQADKYSAQLEKLATKDESVQVRIAATKALLSTSMDDARKIELLEGRIQAKVSGLEMGSALMTLYDLDSANAVQKAMQLESLQSDLLKSRIAEVYANTGNPQFISFYDELLPKQSGFTAFPFFNAYSKMIAALDESGMKSRVQTLHEIGSNQSSGMFTRYAATKALSDIRNQISSDENLASVAEMITEKIEHIKSVETSSRLKSMYGGF